MPDSDALRRLLPRAPRLPSAAGALRAHPAVAGAVATAAVAAGTAGLMLRRFVSGPPEPTVGALAEMTAVSVWDAAKGTVIAEVREAGDGAALISLERPTATAVRDAAAAGADITAAAIGAVEGALDVAHLIHASSREIVRFTASTALATAREIGEPAAVRVSHALRERFPEELRED